MNQLEKDTMLASRLFFSLLISISLIIGDIPAWYRIFLILVGVIISIGVVLIKIEEGDGYGTHSKIAIGSLFFVNILVYFLYAEFSLLPFWVKVFTLINFIVDNVVICVSIMKDKNPVKALLGISEDESEDVKDCSEKGIDDAGDDMENVKAEVGDLAIFFKPSYTLVLDLIRKEDTTIKEQIINNDKVYWFKSVDELIDWIDKIDDGFGKHTIMPLGPVAFDDFTYAVFRNNTEISDMIAVGYCGCGKRIESINVGDGNDNS